MQMFFVPRSGRPLGHVLSVLKDIDRPSYDVLATKFRQYAACVGIVDTGYFRRRRGSRRLAIDDQLPEWIPAVPELSRDYEDEAGPVSF
jgi:hypothetical protein